MGKLIWIWVREDGERPCVLQRGSPPRGPGKVYEVAFCRNRDQAVNRVKLSLSPEPDRREDRMHWAAWEEACESVRAVSQEEFGG